MNKPQERKCDFLINLHILFVYSVLFLLGLPDLEQYEGEQLFGWITPLKYNKYQDV